jgi:hypothetical protein
MHTVQPTVPQRDKNTVRTDASWRSWTTLPGLSVRVDCTLAAVPTGPNHYHTYTVWKGVLLCAEFSKPEGQFNAFACLMLLGLVWSMMQPIA